MKCGVGGAGLPGTLWLGRKGAAMKVYVAQRGCYDDMYIAGVFDSPERAMGAMPGKKWRKTSWADHPHYNEHSHVTWENELDWDDAVMIYEIELTAEGPVRQPDEAVVQTYRASDGLWDYVPETPHDGPRASPHGSSVR